MRFNLGIVDVRVHFDAFPYYGSGGTRKHPTAWIENYMWVVIEFDSGQSVTVRQARQR